MTKFDEVYQQTIKRIMANGIEELNQRTGLKTKALPGVCISLDLEKDGFPVLTLRKQPLKSPIAEQCWFIQGSKDPEFLQRYTKIWNAFLDDDGTLSSAYGYRWRKRFKKDQLLEVIKCLAFDPSSRHAVVITWDPDDDGFLGTPKKNVPCPYTFTLNIIGGRLNMMNVVRSNDMILGCPFDIFGFALLQSMIAQKLGVKPGLYTHVIANAHIYENHYEAANDLITRVNEHPTIQLQLPQNSFNRAENKDDSIVDEIFANLEAQYKPLPAINNLVIAI